jgi:hypothetical protein
MPEVPTPEPTPPLNNPDPRPGDPKPKVPPPEGDDEGAGVVPVELPGLPHAPERV